MSRTSTSGSRRATGRKRKPQPRPVGRPPKSDGEDTRRRILAAAQVEFAENGYRETSNKAVAERAGVTAASIYHYFDGKNDLFLAVHEEIQESVMLRLNAALDTSESFHEAVVALLDESEQIRHDVPSLNGFTAVVRMEALRNPEIEQARIDDKWRKLFHRLTDLGINTGEIDPKRAHLVRTVVAAINLGLVQHAREATDDVHRDCIAALKDLMQGNLLKSA